MSDLQKIAIAIIIACISLFGAYKYGRTVEKNHWEQEQTIIKKDWESKFNAQNFSNTILVNVYKNELEKIKSEENIKYVEKYIQDDNSNCILSGDIIELHNKLLQ